MLKNLCYILLSIVFVNSAYAKPEHELFSRCLDVSKTLEQIGWQQISNNCRHFLWLGSDRAQKCALDIVGKRYSQAKQMMTHARNIVDYTHEDGCENLATIHDMQTEIRAILNELTKLAGHLNNPSNL